MVHLNLRHVEQEIVTKATTITLVEGENTLLVQSFYTLPIRPVNRRAEGLVEADLPTGHH